MPGSGALAEWLGSGLQSRLQRFESARRLSTSAEPAARRLAAPHWLTVLIVFVNWPVLVAWARHGEELVATG
jgi:hypothetical protein